MANVRARTRSLRRSTSLGVLEVALAVGFASASPFTGNCRGHFAVTPTRDRGTGAVREAREEA